MPDAWASTTVTSTRREDCSRGCWMDASGRPRAKRAFRRCWLLPYDREPRIIFHAPITQTIQQVRKRDGKTQSAEKLNWQSRRKAAKTMRSESQVAPHARSKSVHNLGCHHQTS